MLRCGGIRDQRLCICTDCMDFMALYKFVYNFNLSREVVRNRAEILMFLGRQISGEWTTQISDPIL